jgi:hypothetical protein
MKLTGGTMMNATTTNQARLVGYTAAGAASTDYVRIAQYTWLNELPGLVFGLLTVAYIVISLLGLA